MQGFISICTFQTSEVFKYARNYKHWRLMGLDYAIKTHDYLTFWLSKSWQADPPKWSPTQIDQQIDFNNKL